MSVEDAVSAAPRPLPAPDGALLLRMRWLQWGLQVAAVTAVALFPLWLLAQAALAGQGLRMLVAGCLSLVLLPLPALLLAFGRRVASHGGVALLDAQGFRHCLLPAIPWKHVGGIDLERQGSRASARWHLVLAVEPAFLRTIALPLPARMVCAPQVRVDGSGRLTMPLARVEGDPRQLAGMALTIADRWGAPRVSGWRAWQDPARSDAFDAQWKLLRGARG
jgi:hypothetical protein